MIIPFEIESEWVSVHQCLSTLSKRIAGGLKELHFDPTHLLLHLIHSFLDLFQEFIFQSQRFVMIVITLVVVKITLKSFARTILFIASLLRVVLIETITIVPGRTVRLPRAQTHPAEIILARLILADDVIATAVLF